MEKKKEAYELSKILIKNQNDEGFVSGSQATITGSYGISQNIETTALSILCWLNDYEKYLENVEKGIKFLHKNNVNGSYGNTQATILSLKALLKYEEVLGLDNDLKSNRNGLATIIIDDDDKNVIKIPIKLKNDKAIITEDLSKYLSPGEHKIEITMSEGVKIPFSFNSKFYSTKPNNSKDCTLKLEANLNSKKN